VHVWFHPRLFDRVRDPRTRTSRPLVLILDDPVRPTKRHRRDRLATRAAGGAVADL